MLIKEHGKKNGFQINNPPVTMNDPQNPVKSLLPLRFVLGTWIGEGHSFGQVLRGKLTAKLRLQNTFMEIEEQLFLSDGTLDYEDSAWVGFDDTQNRLSVTHFMAPATIERKLVLLNSAGFYWWVGPTAPIVYFIDAKPNLHVQIISSDEALLGEMTYKRAQ